MSRISCVTFFWIDAQRAPPSRSSIGGASPAPM